MRRHVDDVLQIMLHAHHLHVICTSSPWFKVIHMSSPWLTETGDDIRDHIWHQHIIWMSCPWSLMWSPLTQVIQTLFSLSQMWSPLTEVILCYSHIHIAFCLRIIPEVPGSSAHCPFGPQRLGMTLETTYVICMSSLWSPETWDYIRDHIADDLYGPHVCTLSTHHSE